MPPPKFQAFTNRANGRLDRIITDIEVSEPFDPTSPTQPLPRLIPTTALWDTGASKSVLGRLWIEPDFAGAEVTLPPL